MAEATVAAWHGRLLGYCGHHGTCALATVAWYAGGIMERDDHPAVPMTLGNMRKNPSAARLIAGAQRIVDAIVDRAGVATSS